MGKLKKFLTQIKFMMQDTLLYMTQSSIKKFVDSLISFTPDDVVIHDSVNVENAFPVDPKADPEIIKKVMPLFSVDLILGEDSEPAYSNSPMEVVMTIMMIFENGIKGMQEIGQVEQKLLPQLFKTNIKQYLKATEIPSERPSPPDPNDKKQIENEHAWVFDAMVKLRDKIEKASMPLNMYLETYKKY